MDAAGLAVHQLGRAHDAAAEGLADGLMAEANAEQRHLAGKAADHVDADAGILRLARTGRDDDAIGLARGDFIERDLVVAAHFELLPQLAEVLRQVVGEGVVVIDQQDHRRLHQSLSF